MRDALDRWAVIQAKLARQGYRCPPDAGEGNLFVFDRVGCPGHCGERRPHVKRFVKGDDTRSYVVCPRCGGVWDWDTLQRLN